MNLQPEHWFAAAISSLFGLLHFHFLQHWLRALTHKVLEWVWEEEGEGRIKRTIRRLLGKRSHEKHRSLKMSKKSAVKYFRKDAPKPEVTNFGAVGLLAPLDIRLFPGVLATVDLGISFNVPVLVNTSKIALTKQVFAPGEQIVLTGTASVTEPVILALRERVALAYPLASLPEYELSEG